MPLSMTTPPLKAGAAAGPKFIVPRFRKDDWVTDDVLRSRGRAFSMLEPRVVTRLERPSLVSSAQGTIARVLMTLPWWVFLTEAEVTPAEWESIDATAHAFQSLLRLLPAETQFVILVHEKALDFGRELFVPAERLDAWLRRAGRTGNTEVVLAPADVSFTIWAEDAYAVSRDLEDAEVYLVEPASFRRADDALIADLVAPKTDLERTQATLYFQGGNILIGDDFWFIGMDYPTNSLRLGYVVPMAGETTSQAITRAYGAALDGARRFFAIGSRLPVPGFEAGALERPFQLGGERWTELLYFGNGPGTVQPMFHIDMFLTLAGRDAQGRYQVLVGDPRLAAQLLGEPVRAHAMAEIYDDIAEQLDTLGFRVVRTPLPLTYDDDPLRRERIWYFATSNNALVQVTAAGKDVWLPTYGHRKWPELAVTDEYNKKTWADLGFTVHDLGDFHPFAVNLGAAHCVKKYLARG